MKDSKAHIDLIISACKKVCEFVGGVSESDFVSQSMMQSAVIMQLQVIGEIAKRIDDETKERIDVPWNMIVGLRNTISHTYFMLEIDSIWKTATEDVPALEKKLHEYLQKEGTEYIPPASDTSPLME